MSLQTSRRPSGSAGRRLEALPALGLDARGLLLGSPRLALAPARRVVGRRAAGMGNLGLHVDPGPGRARRVEQDPIGLDLEAALVLAIVGAVSAAHRPVAHGRVAM